VAPSQAQLAVTATADQLTTNGANQIGRNLQDSVIISSQSVSPYGAAAVARPAQWIIKR